MHAVVDYLISEDCTSRLLLSYFGEKSAPKCGKCNRCIKKPTKPYFSEIKKDISNYIKNKFDTYDHIEIQEIIASLQQYSKDEILENIRWLIDHDQLVADPLGKTLIRT